MATTVTQQVGAPQAGASSLDPHPDYLDASLDWVLMQDVYKGQRAIKRKTVTYLPTTGGMRALGLGSDNRGPKEGQALYDAYLARARFPDWVRSTISKLIGIVTREDAVIEVPKRLEELIENATPDGESLQNLLVRIYENQLRSGRVGLLIDVDASRNIPYIATYEALSIVNWDDTLKNAGNETRRVLEFVLLDESRYERKVTGKGRSWVWKSRARVLSLQGGLFNVSIEVNGIPQGTPITPGVQGIKFDQIPFVFANAMDLLPDPDQAPLIGLAEICLQVYRTDADYRQALFNQGQDTLVVKGGTLGAGDPRDNDPAAPAQASPALLIGVGAVINVGPEGDAKFIGVESSGLAELRTAIADAKLEAGEYGGELLSAAGAGESGEALTTRVGARTANLPGLVKNGAKALENALRLCAVAVGANPDEVVVQPNMDWVDDPMTGKEAAEWIGAKRLGFPVSMRSIHEMAQKREVTERTYEEELEEIEKEETELPESMAGNGSADPGVGGDEQDDEEQAGDDDAKA